MARNNKSRILAALLAFVGGVFGLHKLYLKDISGFIFFMFLMVMTAGIGIPVTLILGVLDAIRLLNMSNDQFDRKFNNVPSHSPYRRTRTGRTRTQTQTVRKAPVVDRTVKKRHNPYIKTAKQLYKEFELEEAAEQYEKSIEIDNQNKAVWFDLACVYSLLEETDKSMNAIRKAILLGYKDFEKLEKHDDLAFVRIQPAFEQLRASSYNPRSSSKIEAPRKDDLLQDDLLLSQLNKLMELRKKGLLSEQEFSMEKQKLMRR